MTYKFDPSRFWAMRPASISPLEWLTHPANDQAFPAWVGELLEIITDLANPETYFNQRWLVGRLGKSIRWIKEILKRLKQIGMISVRRERRNRMKPASPCPAPAKAPKTAPTCRDNKDQKKNSIFPAWIVDSYTRWRGRTGKRTPIEVWAKEQDWAVGG